MNERVKILWNKAAESNFGDSWEEQTAFMSKFAELIVAECLEFVDPGSWSDDEWDQALIVARENIKKHFGVKE
jgi:hypothetical protein